MYQINLIASFVIIIIIVFRIYRGVENFDYEWRINDKRDPHHYQLQQQQQQYYQRHQCYQSVAEGIATIASSKDRNQPNNNLITTQHVRSCDQTAVHQRSNYVRTDLVNISHARVGNSNIKKNDFTIHDYYSSQIAH